MAPTGTKGAWDLESGVPWPGPSCPHLAWPLGRVSSSLLSAPCPRLSISQQLQKSFPTPPSSPQPDAAHFQHKTGVDGRESWSGAAAGCGGPRRGHSSDVLWSRWMAPPQSLLTHQPEFSLAGSPFSGVSLHLRLPPPWSLAPCSCCGLAPQSGPREPPPGAHPLGWGFHGVAQEKKKKTF